MAVRTNPYNNPQIAAAVGSLAGLFAPMKAADAYAYAHANSEREKAQRAADAYRVVTDPNTTRDAIDRYFIAAYGGNPNQTYGFGADQLRSAEAQNAADNARALSQTRLQQEGENYRTTLKPIEVNKDQTAFLPQPAQNALGLGPVLEGQKSLQPGETVVTATGQTLQGAPKPLTMDEFKAGEAQRLKSTGLLTDQQLADLVAPPGELVKVGGPQGGTYQTRTAAIGKPIYEKPEGVKVEGNYRAPDGRQGIAVAGPNGKLVDSQTGEDLPPGLQLFRSQAQGSVDDLTKTTRGQLERRKLQFDRLIGTADLLEKTLAQSAGNQGIVGSFRGTAQDLIATMHEIGRAANIDTSGIEGKTAEILKDPTVAASITNRDGTIAPARLLTRVLASQAADVLASGDRTSNMELQNMTAALGQEDILANPTRTAETLRALRSWIGTQRAADEKTLGAPAAPVAGPVDGATATNPQTGQKIVRKGGVWLDAATGQPISTGAQ